MRVVFIHIPKTAGTSFRVNINDYANRNGHLLKKCFVYNGRGGSVECKNSDFPKRNLEGVALLSGHLSYRDWMEHCEIRNGGAKFITFLRDPVERVISLYNYITSLEAHPEHDLVSATSAEDFLIERSQNLQFEYLRGEKCENSEFVISHSGYIPQISAMVCHDVLGVNPPLHEFEERKNVTADIPKKKAKLISRNELNEATIRKMYDSMRIDKKMFDIVSHEGILNRNISDDFWDELSA